MMRHVLTAVGLTMLSAACGRSPSSPTPVAPQPPGGVQVAFTTWQGTLAREGQSASLRISATELSSTGLPSTMSGHYTATFPTVSYTGGASGVVDGSVWRLSLFPDGGERCGGVLPVVPGLTQLTLTRDGNRFTGTADVVACDGNVRWEADLRRQIN